MSFSLLSEVEDCPRRWALSRAVYPDIWDGKGYPRPLVLATLEGVVLHEAIETLVKELSARGCSSFRDADAIAAIKTLGGLTPLLERAFAKMVLDQEHNPRAKPALELAKQSAPARAQAMRPKLQSVISRLTFQRRPPPRVDGKKPAGTRLRQPIPPGSHAEVYLEVKDLKWKGIVDLLTLSEDSCEIRDFKTGARSGTHGDQLTIYALLWKRDAQVNPKAVAATSLVISYVDCDVPIPVPAEAELVVFERVLRGRTTRAREEMAKPSPPARPQAERCRLCHVRHLCEDYWQWIPPPNNQSDLTDIEVRIRARHGATSWDAESDKVPGMKILIRTPDSNLLLMKGQRIRLLNVYIAKDDDTSATDPCLIVGTCGSTEFYDASNVPRSDSSTA